MESGIELEKIKNMKSDPLSEEDATEFHAAVERLKSYPLKIEAVSGCDIYKLRRLARLHKKRFGAKLIFIDYVQLIFGKEKVREQQLAVISRNCSEMSKELDVPVVGLAQLNRELEKTRDRRPNLSHLRESGALEQDADGVILIYRPAFYDILTDSTGRNIENTIYLIVAKARNGKTGEAYLHAQLDKMQVVDETLYNSF